MGADLEPARAPRPVVIFDMDGVIVDPTRSYRQTVIETVFSFSRRRITFADIEDYKNQGGWNNDWHLSQRILQDQGVEVDLPQVIDRFNAHFLGSGDRDGLVWQEEWLVAEGLFERLEAQNYQLAIFTGRRRSDALITLNRFVPGTAFSPMVCMEDVERSKPAPDGLLKIRALLPGAPLFFIGDTIDDARSARLAGVPFFGVASKAHPRRPELIEVLRAEGSLAILENVNEIESALSQFAKEAV